MPAYLSISESVLTMQMITSVATSRVNSVPVVVRLAVGVLSLTLLSQVLIPLPFTPVPLSLGTLGAMLLGVLLGPRLGTAAAGSYALLGMVGAPIFAGWSSGVGAASFGYVLGYIAAAGLVGAWVYGNGKGSYGRALAVSAGASAAVYLFGVTWMVLALALPVGTALAVGVVPFLVGDVLKSFVIAGTAYAVKRAS